MKDTVIKDNGKSRSIKAPADMPETFEEWRTQLLAGTATLDIGLNAAGCDVIGTALTKANMLSDTTKSALKLTGDNPTVNDALYALSSALGRAKVATGSYVGTGTSGADNPCSLTFDFTPKFVVVYSTVGLTTSGSTGGSTFIHALMMFPGTVCGLTTVGNGFQSQTFNNSSSNETNFTTFSGNTVSWYSINSTNGQVYQLNVSGVIYKYFAIG